MKEETQKGTIIPQKIHAAEIVGVTDPTGERFFCVKRIEDDDEAARFLEAMHKAQEAAMVELQSGQVRTARWWAVTSHVIRESAHVFVCARMGGEAEGKIEVPGRQKSNGVRP